MDDPPAIAVDGGASLRSGVALAIQQPTPARVASTRDPFSAICIPRLSFYAVS